MNIEQKLHAGIIQLRLDATPEQEQKLVKYLALLEKWNYTYNLTAIRETEKMVGYHLLDSLSVLPHLWPRNWLDVGCGGGLPGLVLAIMRPDWDFTLVDSNSKKIGFVQQAAIELGLKNVQVHCGRIEKWQTERKFDGIISRAFAEASEFVRLTKHLLNEDGRWMAMKGRPEEELSKLPAEIEIEKVISIKVPEIEGSRNLVILGVKK